MISKNTPVPLSIACITLGLAGLGLIVALTLHNRTTAMLNYSEIALDPQPQMVLGASTASCPKTAADLRYCVSEAYAVERNINPDDFRQLSSLSDSITTTPRCPSSTQRLAQCALEAQYATYDRMFEYYRTSSSTLKAKKQGEIVAILLEQYRSIRVKSVEASIKANLSSARATAEVYFDRASSYAGVCTSDSREGLKGVMTAVNERNGGTPNDVICNDEKGSWAAAAQLPNSNTYYCVDSTGHSGDIVGKVGASGGMHFSSTARSCPL